MQLLLEAHNVEKFFADRKIFSFDELMIYEGDKIGIVGANGCGKTTLLNVLYGSLEPDLGQIKRYCEISYLEQFGEVIPGDNLARLSEYKIKHKADSAKMSGGEYTRLKIASKISGNDVLIFADEPTSNLDINGIELVTKNLLAAKSLLLISHDRHMLDKICNKIISIEDGEVVFYNGNFSSYLEQKKLKRDFAQFEYEQYVDEKRRLEESVSQIKKKASAMKSAPKRMGNSEARLHRGGIRDRQKKMAGTSRAMEGRLELLEVKEKPAKEHKVALDFSLTNPPPNKIVIQGENIFFAYPGEQALFKDSNFHIPNGSKTCLYGPNGCGKTTLLNMIANASPNITVAPKAKLGYFHQDFQNLDFDKTLLENAMKDSIQPESTVRTILSRLLFKRDDVRKNVSALSGGEKIKLSLCKLFVSDANVLLLDEPTNYLDITSVEELQKMLSDYPGTVVFVSHDKMLANFIADRLILFRNNKLQSFDGNIEEYEESLRPKSSQGSDHALEKSILEMRLAELTSRLSLVKGLKEETRNMLEAEYSQVLNELKQYR